jgi:hypothetical protein
MHEGLWLAGASLIAIAGSVLAAPADLTVTFLRPETYADAAYSRAYAGEKDRAEVMRDIERHLHALADRSLPPREALRIEVLDIDLAGGFEPWRGPAATDLRVLRGVTWPRIRLRYTLIRGGEVVASAEELVSDMNYLLSANRYARSDRLRYEKAMLDDWFARRIVRRQ